MWTDWWLHNDHFCHGEWRPQGCFAWGCKLCESDPWDNDGNGWTQVTKTQWMFLGTMLSMGIKKDLPVQTGFFFFSAPGLEMIAVSWAVKWDWSDDVWVKTYAFHSRTVLVQILKFHVHVLNLWPNAIHTKRDWVLIAIFPLQKGKRSARAHIQTQI